VKGAEKGKALLERKGDALKMKHKEMAGRLYLQKQELEKKMETAFYLLSRAELYGADLRLSIHQANSAPLSVQRQQEMIAGISFPKLEIAEEIRPMYFLGTSGKLISECRSMFLECLVLLVEVSSTQLAFTLLDEMVLAISRRVNALEHVLIPKIENTIAYVQSELDEQDREEFFRLKKVQRPKSV
ncbi:V-type H+-transporting ATPase subunit D, partial [Nematocida homosporus]|uniref:V-type H+-transporting ATPase subunit D n=1 Tax=Nematocida homosporus TaxID=1912981 RepID=UPI002220E27D